MKILSREKFHVLIPTSSIAINDRSRLVFLGMDKPLYAKAWDPLFNDERTMTSLLHDMGAPLRLQFVLSQIVDKSLHATARPLGAIVTLVSPNNYDEMRNASELQVQIEWSQRLAPATPLRFVPQTIDNACGVFSIINIAINLQHIDYGKGFVQDSQSCSIS